MNTQSYHPNSPVHPALNAIIIYDDFWSGLRAKQTVEFVANTLGGGGIVSKAIWRADLLDHPEVANSVMIAALNADFIVFSLQGDRVPTFGVRQCIENILEISGGSLGLFLLFGSDPVGSRAAKATRKYFYCLCESKGIAFFCHGPSTPGSDRPELRLGTYSDSHDIAARLLIGA